MVCPITRACLVALTAREDIQDVARIGRTIATLQFSTVFVTAMNFAIDSERRTVARITGAIAKGSI